jgi:MGT family glycosyltransferase
VTGSILVMCMGGVGHVQLLLPLVAGFRRRGVPVRVMTHGEFRERVEAMGAAFVDLYAGRPLDAADATSVPVPSRWVTFAGVYAESLAAEVATFAPRLILYDTFTVAGFVVARLLGLPYVNVCPNHAPVPSRMLAALARDPRVATSDACRAAVERLRTVHGMAGANPFSYYETLSPHLNLYCEPEEFLDPGDRAPFAPLAFFGALAPPESDGAPAAGAFAGSGTRRRIYVSFGTVVWPYFEAAATAALAAISQTLAGRDVDVVLSLGRHRLSPAARAALVRGNVRVEDHVDQWATLAEADAFVTHHGISSTHEAIFRRVPMISYPFFGDQPALARRCRDLGLAVPLTDEPRAEVKPAALLGALDRLSDERDRFAARLSEARAWELRTIAGRDAIIDRMLALTRGRS